IGSSSCAMSVLRLSRSRTLRCPPAGRGRTGREAPRSARWLSDERSSYRSAMTTPPIDRRTDEELVAACNSGSSDAATAAFETLYQRHRAYVLRIALRFMREHELAADVLQGTV